MKRPALWKIQRILRVFRHWAKLTGRRAAFTWAVHLLKQELGFRQASTLKIKPRRAMYPLVARLGDSSDISVFQQIFQIDEYSCVRDIASPRLILDLGANVGYSSAYFLSCFPSATVVAVEPDPRNFELCRKNLAPYGDRVRVVLGAVWSRRCRLVLSQGAGDGREWGTQVRQIETDADDATVEAWDVPSLLALTGEKQIDLLKIDIERSELEIFGPSSSSWLPRVRNICIELHGEDCTEVFMKAMRDLEYDLGNSGELTVCRNLECRVSSNLTAYSPPGDPGQAGLGSDDYPSRS